MIKKTPIDRSQALIYQEVFLYLKAREMMRVRYSGKYANQSTGIRVRDRALILSNGFFDAKSMQWQGFMPDRRVADLFTF